MTEVDRIVREGIIPADFLEPEVQCDFFVDKERKKIWAISLDLLIKFDEICNKYNLKYFLVSGSCLGAIRHNGFIPWDDDIDVGMFREDYDKFSKIVLNELESPYFWQTHETDKNYLCSHSKLRNSWTSAIVEMFRFSGFNHGIWLDVFPIDNTVLEGAEKRYKKINELNLENSAHMRRSNPNPTEADIIRLNLFPYRNPEIVMNELQSIATQFNHLDTDYVQMAVCTIYPYEKTIYKKSIFNEIIYIDFENILKVPIPAGYDEYLTICYGDYMKFPPVNERGIWHEGTFYNPDKRYGEHIFD